MMRLCIPIWILKRVQAERCTIQIFVLTSVNSKCMFSSISLCYPSVPFKADNFRPDLVVYRKPFVYNLLNMILR